ncbi:MAG: energy-coupling factor ABC transporter permease [Verrucomicrobiota bacterium]
MHIPDGFLDAKTAATSATLATGGLALAVRQVRRHLPARKVPLLGLAAAFVFAAQMLNFPIIGGTSGHLVGGVLAATLLGPSAAVIAMSCVLIIQCFLFADGGVTALGANILNMAIINPLIGYSVYRLVRAGLPGSRGMIVAAAFASWCATVASAIACAGQLALSGTAAWSLVFPTMTNVHMLIGIGEGLITALVLTAIARARPELTEPTAHTGELVGLGLLTTVGLAVFVTPFACSWPDGLEKIAGAIGFEHKAVALWSGLKYTAVTGALGALLAFALSLLLARWLAPRPTDEAQLSRSP